VVIYDYIFIIFCMYANHDFRKSFNVKLTMEMSATSITN
jgi:hypothetical protein